MYGTPVARHYRGEILRQIQEITSTEKSYPTLGIIQIGADNGKSNYLSACLSLGIIMQRIRLEQDTTEHEIELAIHELNQNPSIHGILVMQPLPISVGPKIFEAIDPNKDVEGLHP